MFLYECWVLVSVFQMTYYWIISSLLIITIWTRACVDKFFAIDQQVILLENEKTLFYKYIY
jgi:hypothetical protein